jgi:serine/threonine-protein kinase
VYSLGICLFEMLTGSVPFTAESQVGVAMKHVRDPLPDVQALRPEMSAALAAVVERATAKERRNRYADAAEMVDDLEQALDIEAARAGSVNGEATSVLRALPSRDHHISPRRLRRPRSLWWGVAIMLLAAAGVAALILLSTNNSGDGDKQAQAPPPQPLRAVRLVAAKDFDPPPGSGEEHASEVRAAIDGNTSTAWSTETYTGASLGLKKGVGLYVSADSPVAARRLEILSSTPGWSGRVYAARNVPATTLAGWGEPIARVRGTRRATVALSTPDGERFQSYLIWIEKLPQAGQVKLSEVRLFG